MADLTTTYMGIPLRSPIIVGASGLTRTMEFLAALEGMGAGAVVTKSLFEEQIQLERFKFDEDLHKNDCRHAEMITVHPTIRFVGPADHLAWVRKVRKAVSIPVIASLNATNRKTWLDYAKLLEDTGVNGLECNFFAAPRHPETAAESIEDEQAALVAALTQEVAIPVSLKLSPFYSNLLNMIPRLDEAGAAGLVLFNRLFEPDISVETERTISPLNLSHDTDYRLALRYTALLEGTVKADLCASGGLFSAEHVAKMILVGASSVQMVSALMKHGPSHIRAVLTELSAWMDGKGYATLADFRGKLSQRHVKDPGAYTRAQYASLLMNPEALLHNAPTM